MGTEINIVLKEAWVENVRYENIPVAIVDELDRLRADSRRLDALLDPEGQGPLAIVSSEDSWDLPRYTSRDEIDEKLGEEPDDEASD